MKVKTSVTLSDALLEAIDALVEPPTNRSAFLEEAAWAYLKQRQRAEQTARDIEIINRRAEYLNQETMDALSYQAPL
jgi:metal-responsive CopG/Arc/MetJ family transcriptional regulator